MRGAYKLKILVLCWWNGQLTQGDMCSLGRPDFWRIHQSPFFWVPWGMQPERLKKSFNSKFFKIIL